MTISLWWALVACVVCTFIGSQLGIALMACAVVSARRDDD